MSPSFTLHLATLGDLPTIVLFRRAMFEDMGYRNRAEMDLTTERFEEWVVEKMKRDEYRQWFAVSEKGEIVAGAGLWLMEWVPHAIDPSTRRANFLNVYTRPEYRRQGLARRLTLALLEWCRENGIRTVILHASADGRALYESLGFRPTNEMRMQLSVPN